jgi:hypothetical protein
VCRPKFTGRRWGFTAWQSPATSATKTKVLTTLNLNSMVKVLYCVLPICLLRKSLTKSSVTWLGEISQFGHYLMDTHKHIWIIWIRSKIWNRSVKYLITKRKRNNLIVFPKLFWLHWQWATQFRMLLLSIYVCKLIRCCRAPNVSRKFVSPRSLSAPFFWRHPNNRPSKFRHQNCRHKNIDITYLITDLTLAWPDLTNWHNLYWLSSNTSGGHLAPAGAVRQGQVKSLISPTIGTPSSKKPNLNFHQIGSFDSSLTQPFMLQM